jgi:hypothetical protein
MKHKTKKLPLLFLQISLDVLALNNNKTQKLPLLFLQLSLDVLALNNNSALILVKSIFIGSNFLWFNGDWLGGIIGVGLLNLGRPRVSEGLFVCRSPDGRIKNS